LTFDRKPVIANNAGLVGYLTVSRNIHNMDFLIVDAPYSGKTAWIPLNRYF